MDTGFKVMCRFACSPVLEAHRAEVQRCAALSAPHSAAQCCAAMVIHMHYTTALCAVPQSCCAAVCCAEWPVCCVAHELLYTVRTCASPLRRAVLAQALVLQCAATVLRCTEHVLDCPGLRLTRAALC
jgi:hypothetical protein